jgi:copper(I)-binding protein
MFMFTTARLAGLAAAALAVPVLLTGCSSGTGAKPVSQAEALQVGNQWIKAADSGMSAAFADFTNTSDEDVHIVDATSPASGRVELHETVDVDGSKMMRPKAGGYVVPAHGKAALTPGGDHLMFIDLKGPLRTGSDVAITLKYADGSSRTITAQVRDFSGNQENYVPTPSTSNNG